MRGFWFLPFLFSLCDEEKKSEERERGERERKERKKKRREKKKNNSKLKSFRGSGSVSEREKRSPLPHFLIRVLLLLYVHTHTHTSNAQKMAEAAEAKPVVEFTKVRAYYFAGILCRRFSFVVAPFSLRAFAKEGKKKVISLSLSSSLRAHFFSLGGDHLSNHRLFVSRAGRSPSSLSLSSRNHLVIVDDLI